MAAVLLWISCSAICFFIMRSKGYPDDKCWAHAAGGLLLGIIWVIVCVLKESKNG